jgi:hypothetical protein
MSEKIKLNMLKKTEAGPPLLSDAEAFNRIPSDKIPEFLQWSADVRLSQKPISFEECDKLASKFKLKTADDVLTAGRFAGLLLIDASELSNIGDLRADLESLHFDKEKTNKILNELPALWEKLEQALMEARLEAIPLLSSLRWRVDVRYASSNYFKKPEPIAILRIGTSDREKSNHIHLELDLERLSWLESTIIEIKNKMLEAQIVSKKT